MVEPYYPRPPEFQGGDKEAELVRTVSRLSYRLGHAEGEATALKMQVKALREALEQISEHAIGRCTCLKDKKCAGHVLRLAQSALAETAPKDGGE